MGRFIYNLYQLNAISSDNQVIILDFSSVISPNFSKFNSEHSIVANQNLITLENWMDSYLNIIKILKNQECIIYYELKDETFGELIVKLILYYYRVKNGIKIFTIVGGLPIGNKAELEKITYFNRYLNVYKKISSSGELRVIVKRKIIQFISKLIPFKYDFLLVGGQKWKEQYLDKSLTIIDAHSHDYSNCLYSNENNEPQIVPLKGDYAVFLDSGSPMFLGDSQHLKIKPIFTKEKWYPALCQFFSNCDKYLKVDIKVAGHYKAPHSKNPDYFKNKEVYFGVTNELIKNSQFVIALTSTAISYAVYYKKPIIFIYNNQLKQEYRTIGVIEHYANLLGSPIINLDEEYDYSNLGDLFVIDESKYLNYEKNYLTSDKGMPSNPVILRELLKNIN